jgi:solute carrier family 25 carnitine/acylcarnitine transporter 20/29
MKEYLLGNLFGISQVIIGYPFDTIKTNLQNSKPIIPLFNSPRLFYKGMQYPLITSMLGTTLMFGNYSYFLEITENKFISASTTGIIGAFLITPFDYLKIQRQIQVQQAQVQVQAHAEEYKKPKYAPFTINRLFTNPKQLFCGLTLTILRESIAIPAYFLTFDYMYYQCHIHPFLSGGIAGINSWLFTYPLDTLKSRRQLYQTKSLYELRTMGSLYNGLGITLLRGFIVNGASFYFYSMVKKNYTL